MYTKNNKLDKAQVYFNDSKKIFEINGKDMSL